MEAFQIMNSGKNCFLTGKAWTWKSWLTNEFIKHQRQQWKFVVVLAPTGIAAINIGWATIHSTFKMFGTYLFFRPIKHQSVDWKQVSTIIIDEISMVGPDYIDYIDHILKSECFNPAPFWGKQIILVGDKAQLPPVYVSTTEEQKKEMAQLIAKYGELTFDKALSYKGFEELTLTEIKRQSDPTFINILNSVREWDRSVLSELKSGYGNDETVHLKPFNTMVDKHNDTKFMSLPGQAKVYDAHIKWEFNIKNAITPLALQLKPGARVMVTKNLECWLVNGDLGTVKECGSDYVIIHSDRFDTEMELEQVEWKEIRYEWNEEVEVGSMKQIPLKLSWAITIHKSQGLTLDNVCLTVTKWMPRDLLYVGLSRATSMEQLYIHHA